MTSRKFIFGAFLVTLLASAQNSVVHATLPSLISQFRTETERTAKERTLNQITTRFPDAGPDLLTVAKEPENGDTNWMAIRGIGYLKFAGAVPFLESSLRSRSVYIRSNSARSLGEIGDQSAIVPLISALSGEEDSGVIEQEALALQMLHASKAIPVLKSKIGSPSPQTRIWILGAIEALGGQAELPFIANSLQDNDVEVRYYAALSVQRLSGQDFGFPPCAGRPGVCSFDESPIGNAQLWWSKHGHEWEK